MAKNHDSLAKEIIEKLGGPANISRIFHCATRLRVQLVNRDAADLEEVKKIAGVMGAIDSVGGVQVIIGNDVNKVFDAALALYPDMERGENTDENLDENTDEKQNIFSLDIRRASCHNRCAL